MSPRRHTLPINRAGRNVSIFGTLLKSKLLLSMILHILRPFQISTNGSSDGVSRDSREDLFLSAGFVIGCKISRDTIFKLSNPSFGMPDRIKKTTAECGKLYDFLAGYGICTPHRGPH